MSAATERPIVLVVFLGRAREKGAYDRATYRFEDGRCYESTFLGFCLFRWLREIGRRPDRLVIVGTPTSMWDALMDQPVVSVETEEDLELFGNLQADLEAGGIRQEHLEQLASLLADSLETEVLCRTVPLGTGSEDHADVLTMLAAASPEGARLFYDITHCLRHLPLLGLLSAFHVRHARNARLEDIRYGAYELKDKRTGQVPVVSLGLASELIDWIEAMAVVRRTGRLGSLREVIPEQSPVADAIGEAAYKMDLGLPTEAKGPANTAAALLDKPGSLPPAGVLYREAIGEITSWATARHYAGRQFMLARRALDLADYGRCALLLVEALISSRTPGTAPGDYRARYATHERLKRQARCAKSGGWAPYQDLCDLRNMFAHLRPPNSWCMELVAQEARLREYLTETLAWAGERLRSGGVSLPEQAPASEVGTPILEGTAKTASPILVGNSLPWSLIRKPIHSRPASVAAFRRAAAAGVCSFWGHANTAEAASAYLRVDVSPAQERPSLELSASGYPVLAGQEFRECWVVSPVRDAADRPAEGKPFDASEIHDWHITRVMWE